MFKSLVQKTNWRNFYSSQKANFSHGPYNPMNYKQKLVGTKYPTTEEIYFAYKKMSEVPDLPVYNMRHLHPIRQSGPIPPYYGDYNMEDVRKVNAELYMPHEGIPESTDVEELLRRVPGLTRKEALKIQTIGLSPHAELDYAYIIVNNGIDIFFQSNNAYLLRQVVTNSKGEKVECLFPTNEQDEFTYMSYSQHIGHERMDESYDPVPGEPPMCPMPDYELGAPNSYFEYEVDNRLHYLMVLDQQFIPEDERPFDQGRNPHCTTTLWRPQQDLKQDDEMRDTKWTPNYSHYNTYNKRSYSSKKIDYLDDTTKL